MIACRDIPISWLVLERYALGELTAAECATVAAHLARCNACATCLAAVRGDTRELAPLVARSPKCASAATATPAAWRRAVPLLGAIAAAAALMLVLRRPELRGRTSEWNRVKGSGVAFALVRSDDGLIEEAAGTFQNGDRFKALVTCSPESHAHFDLVVYEHGEASFPLEAEPELACGNSVPLKGAFRITNDEPLVVCLVWDDDAAVDRVQIASTAPSSLERALCKDLAPYQGKPK